MRLTCPKAGPKIPTHVLSPFEMIGQVLGHYRVLQKIGAGGMGEVYRARDERLGRDVAVKVLKPSFANDPDRLRRFELEARSSAALSHPNIVAVYDIGMHDGAPYIVSELLEGMTLRQRLLQGPLSPRQTSDYGTQIAQGLVAAHEKRIVHRDLKPENLFITRDGHVKILDFGIAKLISGETREQNSIESMATQTRLGSVLGTVRYMSPEQVRGKPVDPRSDIFSLGAILYEMLTGKAAFVGDTEADTMMAVLKEDPAEMAPASPPAPAAFEQIVRHCLEKEPENRFQSARDLAFALSTASQSTSRQFVALRPRQQQFRKWLAWLAAAALLAVVGIYLGTLVRPASDPAYRRISFERGTIYSARFGPDGRSILYGAAWNGRPLQLYSTVGDSPLARPLGFTAAHLLTVSRSSELAVVLHGTPDRRAFTGGVLARSPLAGGTPRELLEDVRAADWSPQGELAVVHDIDGESRLEYPIGKVLYPTSGWISDVRFSPGGESIAFLDHPATWDDRGSVCVIDLGGKKKTLSSGWESEAGLAWSPRGTKFGSRPRRTVAPAEASGLWICPGRPAKFWLFPEASPCKILPRMAGSWSPSRPSAWPWSGRARIRARFAIFPGTTGAWRRTFLRTGNGSCSRKAASRRARTTRLRFATLMAHPPSDWATARSEAFPPMANGHFRSSPEPPSTSLYFRSVPGSRCRFLCQSLSIWTMAEPTFCPTANVSW